MTESARFTPTMDQAERIVRLLHNYYSQRTPGECREALARMYGHPDWENLQLAAQSGEATGDFDESAAPEVASARFQQQYDMVLVHLAGMTDDVMLAAQELDQEVLSSGADSISKRYHPAFNHKRLQRARYAWNLAYARHAILEARPTGREAADIPKDRDDIELSFRVDLLPRALKAWLCHHRPVLRDWGAQVGQMRVRQHCATDLLKFSFFWGEFCLQDAVDIPLGLQLYPLALCAKWFAWLTCSKAPHLQSALAMLGASGVDEARRSRAEKTVVDAIHEEEARFILAQPREDFRSYTPSAREQQMKAGYAIVKRCMTDAATECTVKEILTRTVWPTLSPAMPGVRA